MASVLTAVRCAVEASHVPPISTSSGSTRPAPVPELQVPGAADELARVETALGERHDQTAIAVGEQPVDVALGLGEPVGHGRVGVARTVDGARSGEVGRLVASERLQLDVGTGQRERLDGRRHLADRSPSAGALLLLCSVTPSNTTFDTTSILPDDHDGYGDIDDIGELDVLHDREYRVRAFRLSAERLLIRGAVRDQKPPNLYIVDDDQPLTIHHMQIDLEVAFPSLEIVAVSVRFETHPHGGCPSIVDNYGGLVGLSIARGFTAQGA